MPDPYIRSALDAYVVEYFEDEIQSSFVQRNPLLYLMSMMSGESLAGKLGNPKATVVWGGASIPRADLEMGVKSFERQLFFEKNEPDDGTSVEYGGVTPVPSGYAEDNKGSIGFRYCHFIEPLQIRKHAITFAGRAKGEQGIGHLMSQSTSPVLRRLVKRINQMLWHGGTGANGSQVNMNSTAQQDAEVWREPLGLVYSIGTQNNLYGRVDRSQVTQLNPFLVNAATDFTSTVADLDMIQQINNGFRRATAGTDFDGIVNRAENGIGVNCVIVPSYIFNTLRGQAQAMNLRIISGDTEHSHPYGGFTGQIIDYNGVYIISDPNCPAGTAYCLTLDEALMEIDPDANFTWSGFTDESRTVQGGRLHEWGDYGTMFRFVPSRKPWLNGTVTNLTAA